MDRKEYKKQYREKNKEKIKEYYQKNKEKIKEQQTKYNQTEKCKKIKRISQWKSRGIVHQNYDELYEKYINLHLYILLCFIWSIWFYKIMITKERRTTY